MKGRAEGVRVRLPRIDGHGLGIKRKESHEDPVAEAVGEVVSRVRS